MVTNTPNGQTITTAISVAAFCLGVFNFVLARLTESKKTELEVGRLLDRAWSLLYGPASYSQTGDQSKLNDAESAVNEAALLDGKNSRVARYQGLLFEVKGNKSAAVERYKKSARLNPHYCKAHESLGRLLEGQEAIASFQRAIECDPKDAWPHYNLGRILQTTGRLDKAKYHFQEAVNLQPRNATLLVELARHLTSTGHRNEAREIYEKAISITPTHVDALIGLGMILIDEHWDEGVSWIEEAMRANPRDSFPYQMMAAVYADKNKPEKALEYYEKAVRIDPKCRLSNAAAQEMAIEMKKILAKSHPFIDEKP
jgi:tetratricopeptide (TPR) repeat protein